MTREAMVDVIRAELRRQARAGKITVEKADQPDAFRVVGILDVQAIVDAIKQ